MRALFLVFGIFPGRADELHWSNGGLSIWNVDCVIPSALNTWRHIVATYQNGVGRRVYVDGNLICSDAASGTLVTSNAPVIIGGGEKELMDDFKIYNRALSLTEIQAEYSHQKRTTVIFVLRPAMGRQRYLIGKKTIISFG